MDTRINFKTKVNLLNTYSNIKEKSIINAPVLYNNKVIGVIGGYNSTTDEVYGWLNISLTANLFANGVVSNFEIEYI